MSLRTPLARARGLGSAKEGTQHWWGQRVTAIALVPLTLWFVISLMSVATADYATVTAWIGQPLNGIFLLLFLLVLFYHAYLGMQVVIEDYVHNEVVKLTSILVMKFVLALLAVAAVIAVVRIVLGDAHG